MLIRPNPIENTNEVKFDSFFEFKDNQNETFEIVPILQITSEKNEDIYRTKISINTISEFEFRQYLFSRQIKV